jgi:hypothetical protein
MTRHDCLPACLRLHPAMVCPSLTVGLSGLQYGAGSLYQKARRAWVISHSVRECCESQAGCLLVLMTTADRFLPRTGAPNSRPAVTLAAPAASPLDCHRRPGRALLTSGAHCPAAAPCSPPARTVPAARPARVRRALPPQLRPVHIRRAPPPRPRPWKRSAASAAACPCPAKLPPASVHAQAVDKSVDAAVETVLNAGDNPECPVEKQKILRLMPQNPCAGSR